MGLYDEDIEGGSGFSFNFKKFKMPLLILIALVIIAFLLIQVAPLVSNKPVSLSLRKQVSSSGEPNVLLVNVRNTFAYDLNAIVVEVLAIDSKSLDVFPSIKDIEILGKNESRELDFSVMPRAGIPNGDYALEVKARINNQDFIERITLSIK